MKLRQQVLYLFKYFKFHVITHKCNFILTKLLYKLIYKNNRYEKLKSFSKIKKNKLIFFNNENGYLENDKNLLFVLSKICNYTSKYQNESSVLHYVLKKNFTFMQYNHSNQKHCDELPTELLEELKFSLIDSDTLKLIEMIYGCYYTVINIRSWIFYPLEDINDDHIHQHKDGFPTGILKIMFYQGNFDQQPALEVLTNGKNEKIIGSDPLVIFDPSKLPHGAKSPLKKERPTIEITLMPKNIKNFDIQQSGFQAGYPVNPFKNINKNLEKNNILYS